MVFKTVILLWNIIMTFIILKLIKLGNNKMVESVVDIY